LPVKKQMIEFNPPPRTSNSGKSEPATRH
jgi:hypothetical protein